MIKKINMHRIILYSLPYFIVCCIYLIGFYPGFMSPDSFSQWEQVQTLKLEDWHPVAHTLFNYLITRLWNSPAAISISQIVMLSLIVGYGFYTLEKIGANKYLLYIIAIFFSLYPANGFMAISLWKDIPYSGMLLLLTIICINIVFSNGYWLDKNSNIVLLILTLIGVIFFRHNGILPFACTMLLLLILFKGYRKKMGVLTIALIVLYIFVKGPIYNAMRVIPAQETEAFGIPMQQIAAVVSKNGNITNEQKKFIANVLPLDIWGKHYNRYSSDPLKFNKDFNARFLTANKLQFLKTWVQICMQNPGITFKAYTDQISLVWRFTNTQGDYTFITELAMQENKFNIKRIETSPKVSNILTYIFRNTQRLKIKWLFWKPAFELYIILILGTLCSVRVGRKMLLTMVPVLSNAACFLLATPAQDYRYLYSLILVSALFIPLYITVINKRGGDNIKLFNL
jgi:hypothetical protein